MVVEHLPDFVRHSSKRVIECLERCWVRLLYRDEERRRRMSLKFTLFVRLYDVRYILNAKKDRTSPNYWSSYTGFWSVDRISYIVLTAVHIEGGDSSFNSHLQYSTYNPLKNSNATSRTGQRAADVIQGLHWSRPGYSPFAPLSSRLNMTRLTMRLSWSFIEQADSVSPTYETEEFPGPVTEIYSV